MDRRADRKGPRKSEDRRAQITAAALRCLRRDGYASLTARKIAEEAGLALGHLTYHFGGMDEILAEAYRLASNALLEATDKDMSRSPDTPLWQLRAFLGAGFTGEFLQRDYLRMRVDLWSAALAHPDIASAEFALYQRYRQSLTVVLARIGGGAAPSDRLVMVTDAIMAMLDGLWLDWMRRQDPAAIENGLEACVTLAETLLSKADAQGQAQP